VHPVQHQCGHWWGITVSRWWVGVAQPGFQEGDFRRRYEGGRHTACRMARRLRTLGFEGLPYPTAMAFSAGRG